MTSKHFLSVADLSSQQIWKIFSGAKKLKTLLEEKDKKQEFLKNKTFLFDFKIK